MLPLSLKFKFSGFSLIFFELRFSHTVNNQICFFVFDHLSFLQSKERKVDWRTDLLLNTHENSCGAIRINVQQLELSYPADGNVNGHSHFRKQFLQKLNLHVTQPPYPLRVSSRKMKACVHMQTYTWMCIETWLTIAKMKQSKYSS